MARHATPATAPAHSVQGHIRRLRSLVAGKKIEEAAPAASRAWMDALRESLQMAATLEFATVPPYLCALWSIKHELDPAAVSIREIVQQEMLHMGLVCNMLVAVGGTPQITSAVPSYPTALPGGVHKGLQVKLAGLSRSTLEDFMWIERPVKGVQEANPHKQAATTSKDPVADETIGEFYDSIKAAFVHYRPQLSLDHQITGPLAWRSVATVEDVEETIELIKTQGEGSAEKPTGDRGSLSHYYRFREVYEGHELIWNRSKRVLEGGKAIAFPDVWPMGKVPKGGYREEDVTRDEWHLIDGFDDTFTTLLDQLQSAWTERGGQAFFIRAIATMFELERYAKPLMQIPIPKDRERRTYGPCFRYKARVSHGRS